VADDSILVRVDGSIATITLNRPEALNALSASMRSELSRVFLAIEADAAIAVVILTGAGDRAFSAGLDLKELSRDGGAMAQIVSDDPSHNLMLAMDRCTKPIVGAINGVAITGGLELAMGCDILVASSNARFADTHIRVGAIPGWGLSQRLSRAIGLLRAKEMSLTARMVDAATAERWGLVNRIVAPDALMPTVMETAQAMAAFPVCSLARYKSLIDRGAALAFGEGRRLERHEARAAGGAFMLPDPGVR
jgi:enoyl-CoA hydratase